MKKVLLLFFMISVMLFSQVELKVDEDEIYKDQIFTIIVIGELDEGFKIKGLDNENFEAVRHYRKTVYFVNNGVSGKTDATYVEYIALKPGKYEFYVSNDEKIASNKVSILVKESPNDSGLGITKVFNNELRKQYYLGEKIVLVDYLKTKASVRNIVENNVKFENFLIKNFEKKRFKPVREVINGEEYIKYTLNKRVLTPIITGNIDIPRFRYNFMYRWDGFAFDEKINYGGQKLNVIKPPVTLNPKNSKIVGKNLNLYINSSEKTFKLGDSLILKLKLAGEANLDGIDKIKLPQISGFEIYQNLLSTKEDIVKEKYYAEKEFEIILVPKNKGVFEIKPIELNYFDTEKKEYVTLKTKMIKLNVLNNNEIKKDNIIKIEAVKVVDGKVSKTSYYVIALQAIIILSLLGYLIYIKKLWKKIIIKNWSLIRQTKKINSTIELYSIFALFLKENYGFNIKTKSKGDYIHLIKDRSQALLLNSIIDYFEKDKIGQQVDINILKEKIIEFIRESKNEKMD